VGQAGCRGSSCAAGGAFAAEIGAEGGSIGIDGGRSRTTAPALASVKAKTHLAALLDAVSAGEQITLTRLRQFSQGQSLGGISIAELRDQGRR
jgi:hypothetical protein